MHARTDIVTVKLVPGLIRDLERVPVVLVSLGELAEIDEVNGDCLRPTVGPPHSEGLEENLVLGWEFVRDEVLVHRSQHSHEVVKAEVVVRVGRVTLEDGRPKEDRSHGRAAGSNEISVDATAFGFAHDLSARSPAMSQV